MRRLMVAGATLALLGGGLFFPAYAQPASGPTDALTAGTVRIAVGTDPIYGFPTWTTTISGQVAAGGRTYSGTASGTSVQAQGVGVEDFAAAMSFSGTSSTGSIDATCGGGFVTVPGVLAPDSRNLTGLLQENCNVSIDGARSVDIAMVFAVGPTTDPTVYQGVYAAAPDAAGLSSIPIVSLGHASASIVDLGGGPPTLGFGFDGQVSVGLNTYRGSASGGSAYSSGTLVSIDVPPFTLSGSSLTGGLNVTCSDQFVSDAVFGDAGTNSPALAVLGCDGSANGGAPGHVTLVSVYRETGSTIHAGMVVDYDGAFVGV